jgi:hypothetical protein
MLEAGDCEHFRGHMDLVLSALADQASWRLFWIVIVYMSTDDAAGTFACCAPTSQDRIRHCAYTVKTGDRIVQTHATFWPNSTARAIRTASPQNANGGKSTADFRPFSRAHLLRSAQNQPPACTIAVFLE